MSKISINEEQPDIDEVDAPEGAPEIVEVEAIAPESPVEDAESYTI